MSTRFISLAVAASMMLPSMTVAQEAVSPLTLGDPILHWNAIALEADRVDHSGTYGASEQGGPGKSSRALAITHIAMFDAVNSIDGSYQPYLTKVPVVGQLTVSTEAAVAEAAYTTLTALYPKQKKYFSDAYKSYLAQIPTGSAKMLGTSIGKVTAAKILLARRHDGSERAEGYVSNNEPGRHREDPLNVNQGIWGTFWGQVKPFSIQSGSQFRAAPPPALNSPEYTAAYEEVKEYGSDGDSYPHHRDQNQTEMGIFWAYDGVTNIGTPPRLYNQIVRQIAAAEGNTVVENARLFALVNIAQADAGVGAWDSKFYYNYWRPIVAIRDGELDGNPDTVGNPTWTPLGAPASNSYNPNFTPPFPAYPSGHATFGAAAFSVVKNFYGTTNMPFTFMSDEMNGVNTDNQGVVRPASPRTYNNLEDAIFENGKSRIYLGIHWNFDATSGITMGKSIADYVFNNSLKPVNN